MTGAQRWAMLASSAARAIRQRRLPSGGLIKTTIMMFAVRLSLWCMPYPRFRAYLERRRDTRMRNPRAGLRVDPSQIAWQVGLANALIPRSTCLVRALVAEQLLAEAGYASVLRLGVATTTDGAFMAHAWLECDGRVLIGGDTSPFTAFESVDRSKTP
ncbi:MAG TPA: lasso peptide biosynthesis B2 protein [Gemmatimonadaceae bacterium]|nr:lasso peptide biosynthesis B2 protein [Gemmatimonadaceae bacterium]